MLGGEFKTPMDLVELPQLTFYKSMKNLLYIAAAMFVYILITHNVFYNNIKLAHI